MAGNARAVAQKLYRNLWAHWRGFDQWVDFGTAIPATRFHNAHNFLDTTDRRKRLTLYVKYIRISIVCMPVDSTSFARISHKSVKGIAL